MKGPAVILATAWFSLCFTGLSFAEPPVERAVVFQDGSILWVTLQNSSLALKKATADGSIVSQTLQLSEVRDLKLVARPVLEEQARVGVLIHALGDDSFKKREQAQADLIVSARGFGPYLRQVQQQTTDPEVRARLKQVLEKLPFDESEPDKEWDQLVTMSGGEAVPCDLGAWSASGRFHDVEVTLDRATVQRITSENIDSSPPTRTAAVSAERIQTDEDRLFPNNLTRIGFDTTPDGKAIAIGENVGRLFIPKGFTISTSVSGSIVSVNNFDVGGRSRGLSCATHQPLWEGVLTIRFCLPGNDRVAAGVTHVGLWIAEVTPNGTKMEAYDAQDRLLAEIKTVASGHDFLAVRSPVPIATIKIVPNLQIDPNYTIDDLAFDTPMPLSEWGDPKLFTFILGTGERLKCQRFQVEADHLNMEGVSAGIAKLSLPLKDVAVARYPTGDLKLVAAQDGFWVMLADGSILHAHSKQGPVTDRFPGLKVDSSNIAALWGNQTAYREPRENSVPVEGQVLVMENTSLSVRDLTLKEWTLGATSIEPSGVKLLAALIYETSPMLWFRNIPVVDKRNGLVTLASGERIVLGEKGFSCKSWSAEGVVVVYKDAVVNIPASEVLSITLLSK